MPDYQFFAILAAILLNSVIIIKAVTKSNDFGDNLIGTVAIIVIAYAVVRMILT